MKQDVKSRAIWGIGSAACLAVAYWLCRFVFFELHGMKQWPMALAAVGLVVLVIAAFTGSHTLSVMTVAGYLGGFFLGILLHTHGTDPGGGGTSTDWIIWTAIFLISMLVGLILDMVHRHKMRA